MTDIMKLADDYAQWSATSFSKENAAASRAALQSAIEALQAKLDELQRQGPVAYDDKSCADMPPSRVMERAHSFCPTELPHLDRMAWMADYFLRNYAAPKALEPITDEQILEAIRNAPKMQTTYAGWVRDQRIAWGRAILAAAHGITKGTP